jgi:hypothetical protein
MKKIILGGLAAAAVIAPIAAMAAPASAAQPTSTTHNITVAAASEAVIDLPALNNQFTKMQITVDGTANWGADESGYWTSYANGKYTTGAPMTSGVWNNGGVEDGPLLLERTQVGTVIYRVDGGLWQEVTAAPIITATDGGTHHVQVAYNDRPGSYYDNFGSLSVNVVRNKG